MSTPSTPKESNPLRNFADRDQRPKRGWWAPGGYISKCHICDTQFIGDKRAGWCAPCAYAKTDEELAPKEAAASEVTTQHDGAAGEQKPSEQACNVCQGRGYRIFPLGGTRRRKHCWKCRGPVCPHCEGTGFDAPHANRWCDFCAGTGLATPDTSGAPTSEAEAPACDAIRWQPVAQYISGGYVGDAEQDPTGDYVRYSDYAALQLKYYELKNAVRGFVESEDDNSMRSTRAFLRVALEEPR